MLTKRQNFIETINGGSPDRFVNQFEPFRLVFINDPLRKKYPGPKPGEDKVDGWGVTKRFALGTPAPIPVHDAEHTVVTDIEHWRDQISVPELKFAEGHWDEATLIAAGTDREEQYLCLGIAPGLLEHCHYLMGMEAAMMGFVLNPNEMREIINHRVEWEIEYAQMLIDRLAPDALFHHDDWGSSQSTLLSPDMFRDFFLEPYKKLYGFFKANGIEVIVHHSDSYAATLVPSMIEMGIDVWQGCLSINKIPELIREYGGQISFMGGIDNSEIDTEDWSKEKIAEVVQKVCSENGRKYFIPNTAQGEPASVYPEVYEAVSAEIEKINSSL